MELLSLFLYSIWHLKPFLRKQRILVTSGSHIPDARQVIRTLVTPGEMMVPCRQVTVYEEPIARSRTGD